jgi:hypothetical protein
MMRNTAVAFLLIVAACTGSRDKQSAPGDSSSVGTATQPSPGPEANLPSLSSDSARKLMPADETAQDTSFARFRNALLTAVQKRDTVFLYSVLAEEIKNSFGGDDSIAGFRRMWRPQEPDSRVWSTIERILKLGSTKEGDSMFEAPYVYSKWPHDVDAFENIAIVSKRAIVRALPNDTAQALGTLSYDIVPARDWEGLNETGAQTPDTWAHVKLPDGKLGWVKGADAYSPVGYRAFFEKRNGVWKIVILVAGD